MQISLFKYLQPIELLSISEVLILILIILVILSWPQ